MKNITFSADESLIRKAREKARMEHRSLNMIFRMWLEEWTRENSRGQDYDSIIEELSGCCEAGSSFTRDEMNER